MMDILIADDEPLARARLASLLGQCDDTRVVASVGDAEAALAACAEFRPQLLLLDVRMPGLDGLQLARRLEGLSERPQVVFCTAFEAHALDAYEVRAADYLLKPVSLQRLQRALVRVRELGHVAASPSRDYLHARVRDEMVRISLHEVFYLLADEKYVAAHLERGTVLLDESLKSLEQAFPERLQRLHRNCLIPRERLLGLKTAADGHVQARIAGCDELLEVSRRNLAAVRKVLRGDM